MAINSVQVIIGEQTHTLTLNLSTGCYEKTITAPSMSSYNVNNDHYYPVTVKATDTAGNTTIVNDSDSVLGSDLKLQVKEITKPAITITSPTESARITNNKPKISWKITDDDSGVDPDTIGITINSGNKITSGITKIAITGGYQCTYTISTALPDGNNTIKIDGSDYDGNAAVQRSITFVVDTVPPTLTISSPANNLVTNNSMVTVAGITNDVTSSPVTLTVKHNDELAESVTVGSNGAFSTTLSLIEGANTIVITATDSAGKSSSVTRTVTLDTQAPIINEITITPNPVSTGELITVSVKVTD